MIVKVWFKITLFIYMIKRRKNFKYIEYIIYNIYIYVKVLIRMELKYDYSNYDES